MTIGIVRFSNGFRSLPNSDPFGSGYTSMVLAGEVGNGLDLGRLAEYRHKKGS